MKVILEGVTGSMAYGLNTSNSDVDLRGVYVAPTRDILSLKSPPEVVDRTKPDSTHYEVGKFMRLALKCNPNIIEMLYLTVYTQLTWEGLLLIENRDKFLSKAVYDSYAGYSISQAHKLNSRAYSELGRHHRHEKHARHCFRLLKQGRQLLETGTLTVMVDNREELFEIGMLDVDALVTKFEEEFKSFKTIKSVLPDKPDEEAVNRVLLEIRDANYQH